MSVISNSIEDFIKSLLTDEDHYVDLQRNELAQFFHCSPSQINYVLATRFTLEQGYRIESRRGGGGYIRITRLSPDTDEYLLELMTQRIGSQLTQEQSTAIVEQLYQHELITINEAALMAAATANQGLNLPVTLRNQVRATLMKNMVLAIINQQSQGGES